MPTLDPKPTTAPPTPFKDGVVPLHRQGDWLWVPLKGEWRDVSEKPEEVVRQHFVHRLVSEYGYELGQMDQERRTTHGHTSPRVDIVVCRDADALRENRDYVLAIECKSDTVKIIPSDYNQGESYARAVGCEFLVLHNNRETRFFRLVPGAPGQRIDIEDIPKASDLVDPARLQAIRRASKAFSRDEFRRLLSECHDILRDNHKMEPGQAFDEISKILFIKMWVERTGAHWRFTEEFLNDYAKMRGVRVEEVKDDLFDDTKRHYRVDDLFDQTDQLNVSFETFRRIVEKLQRFNLSATGEDVKGIAFERFLGQTFRGELGQFFTPRPIVEFMVEMLDPTEGEVICDPASGSGGFLIKCFEHVRTKIETDILAEKELARQRIAAEATTAGWDEEEQIERLEAEFQGLNRHLDVQVPGSRLHRVAHEGIFGTDAEKRAARTSKMNMIMHGDGHGGIHYHDGLLDTNGIFAGRFDVIVTNPPFGSTVGKDQVVGATEQTRVTNDPDVVRAYERRFGDAYLDSHRALADAVKARVPILRLFDIGRDPIGSDPSRGKVREARDTEMLFIERCLNLLKPGGRLGIVLPEGILNNPSNQWLRDYCEGRAAIVAVVSIPMEVFASSDATVKTSIVFLRRYTAEEEHRWACALDRARAELAPVFEAERARARVTVRLPLMTYGRADLEDLARRLEAASDGSAADIVVRREATREYRRLVRESVTAEDRAHRQTAQRGLQSSLRAIDAREAKAVRRRAKEICDYPVFAVEVEHAGITGTGDTGEHVPNQLPEVVRAFRRFRDDPAAFEAEDPAGAPS